MSMAYRRAGARSRPREVLRRLERSRVMAPVDNRRVWTVTCFFMGAPTRPRPRGSRLLRAAMALAARHGGRLVEGHPTDTRDKRTPGVLLWTGTRNLPPRGLSRGGAPAHHAAGDVAAQCGIQTRAAGSSARWRAALGSARSRAPRGRGRDPEETWPSDCPALARPPARGRRRRGARRPGPRPPPAPAFSSSPMAAYPSSTQVSEGRACAHRGPAPGPAQGRCNDRWPRAAPRRGVLPPDGSASPCLTLVPVHQRRRRCACRRSASAAGFVYLDAPGAKPAGVPGVATVIALAGPGQCQEDICRFRPSPPRAVVIPALPVVASQRRAWRCSRGPAGCATHLERGEAAATNVTWTVKPQAIEPLLRGPTAGRRWPQVVAPGGGDRAGARKATCLIEITR